MSKKYPKKYQKNIEKSTPKKSKNPSKKVVNFQGQKKHQKNIDFRGVKIPDAPKTEKSIFSENVGKY